MSVFTYLDEDTRTLALVGSFLQHWAFMEARVNSAIGKALGLGIVQEAIVTSNITFRDKIHILRTTVSDALMDSKKREKFDNTLVSMLKSQNTRNMMAHNLFLTSEDKKGVEFIIYRAKGKFSIPRILWTVAKFEASFERIKKCTKVLDDLESELENAALIGAMLNARNRRGLIGSEDRDNHQGSPPPNLLDLIQNPSIQEISDETSRVDPEKDDEE